jgi:dipeptidyl aminopeptidase/acylaminoacyl peptidase
MASRGYAVLQPNFRGSTGYGLEHLEAGYGQWGRKMQSDLSDGVRALAAEGVIDPKRVAIVGASYGGYAAMAGVTLDQRRLPLRRRRRGGVGPAPVRSNWRSR